MKSIHKVCIFCVLALTVLLSLSTTSFSESSSGSDGNETYHFVLWTPNWGAYSHSLEAMEKDIRNALNGLGMRDARDAAWDVRVDMTFRVARMLLVLPDGQYQAMELPANLVFSKKGSSKPVFISLTEGTMIQINRQGSQATYRIEFKSFPEIQDFVKKRGGDFHEGDLWITAQENLVKSSGKLLKAVVAWVKANSLTEAETLLSNEDYEIRIGVISLLESAQTPAAIKLLRKVLEKDRSETVRKEAREALARIQKPRKSK